MSGLDELKAALTKNGYFKVADVIIRHPRDKVLENIHDKHKGINLNRVQIIEMLSGNPDTGELPKVWDDIRSYPPQSVSALVFISVLFSHHKLIRTFAASMNSEMQGTIQRDSIGSKAYTNLVYSMQNAGLCTVVRGSRETSYNFSVLFRDMRIGPSAKQILRLKLEKTGWSEPDEKNIFTRTFYEQCFHYKFHETLGISQEQFIQWLEGKHVEFTDKSLFIKKEGKKLQKSSPVIKIKTLDLENIGPFKSLSLKFDPECSVLIGLNGVGKTTLLRSAALALIGRQKGIRESVTGSLLRIKGRGEAGKEWAFQGTISVSAEINGKLHFNTCTFFPDLSTGTIQFEGKPFPGFLEGNYLKTLVLGFGQQRGLSGKGGKIPAFEIDPPKIGDLLPLINNEEGNHLHSFASWIANLDIQGKNAGLKKHPLVDKAFTVISHIIEEDIQFDAVTNVDPLEIWVKTKDSPQGIPLELTSQGYQTVMGWIGCLLERMYEANEGADYFYKAPAIVLIDEIDLFLHPRWQRNILRILKEHFPNTQFIVTTHSPLVVDGLEQHQPIRLSYHKDSITAEYFDVDIWAWAYQDILERIFDTYQDFEQYEEKVLPEIKKLQAIHNRTNKQEKELQRLESVLHRIEDSRAAVDEIAAIRQRLDRKERELTELLNQFGRKQV